MSNEAPVFASPSAARGMVGGVRPASMMFGTITTRMRGGAG